MGTSIVIPGANFSQSGFLTKNYVELHVTSPGYIYYGGETEVYTGDYAIKNWSSKLYLEEGVNRIPLFDNNNINFKGFDFKHEKIGESYELVRPNAPKFTKITINGDLPLSDSMLFLGYMTDLGVIEADFSGLTKNHGETPIHFLMIFPSQTRLSTFIQPNTSYIFPVASFKDNTSITSLNLSNVVSIDGINAIFNRCTNLQFIDFSNLQIATIAADRNGFVYCDSLTSIKVTNASASAKANLITKLADVNYTFVEQNGYLVKQ